MNALIFVHSDLKERIKKITETISSYNLSINHPDLLYLEDEEKLGVEETKKIRGFLSLKPYQANIKALVIESAENLTLDAQNSLLKTLEEPPGEVVIILGVDSEYNLLPTIISRCQIEHLDSSEKKEIDPKLKEQIEKLSSLSIEERFKIIEKLEERGNFLKALSFIYREKMHKDKSLVEFTKELLKMEEYGAYNVNLRGILEYLMLILP